MSKPVFMFEGDDEEMVRAYEAAQQSFKYFWRELSWERRRIVPGLDMAMVKVPFSDGPRDDGQPEFEHMWIGDVDFDGEVITGELLNAPNWLTSVEEGDEVETPLSEITDWMMVVNGVAYGAFTVNVMRAKMNKRERKQHDEAWGLDFGDPAEVRLEIGRGEKSKKGAFGGLFGGRQKKESAPDTFHDHPMCVNMLEKIEEQLRTDPEIAIEVDETGWTMLQSEALAGNFGAVKLLVAYGADVNAQTPSELTAAELAREIGWSEIADFLDSQPKAQ